MVSGERVDTGSRARAVDDLEPICTQTTQTDGVTIMPRLDQKQYVNRVISTNLK